MEDQLATWCSRVNLLCMILIWDHLADHRNDAYDLLALCQRDDTHLPSHFSSWVNMSESTQRIIVRRTLSSHYYQTPEQSIEWLEQRVTS